MKKLTFFSFFFLLINLLYTATLLEIRDDIRSQLKDNSSIITNRRWSDTLLQFRVNEIMTNICEQTRCLITRISTSSVANQREYNFPVNMIAPIRLAYVITNSTPPCYKALTRFSIAGLDNEISTWESSPAGLPTKYYERGGKFGLQPMPSAVYASTYAVQMDYYVRASSMSADGDIPFNAEGWIYPYHRLLILGTVIWCRNDMQLTSNDLKNEYYSLLLSMYNAVRNRDDKKDNIYIPSR